MRKFVYILFFLIPFQGMPQQTYQLTGQIRDLPEHKVYLLNFYGERNTLLDSTLTDQRGQFTFPLSWDLAPGMYRVNWGKDKFTDLVFNRENIQFQSYAEPTADSVVILQSQENKLYYDYLKIDRVNQTKLELLQPLVEYYPNDQFYKLVSAEYEMIQRTQKSLLDSLSDQYPGSYAVKLFKVYQTPFLSAALTTENRMAYLKQHYFDLTDFTDTSLLRSSAFANKAISYLSLYGNARMPQKQLELEFIKGVTVIMNSASVNSDVYKFLLDYLVGGFDKYHFDEVIEYMAENFSDPFSCEDAEKKSALQKKLDTFKKIAIGKPAPKLEVADTSGRLVDLYEIPADYTLVIFWSSDCPHCTNMIPRVKEIYSHQQPKKMEIMAVSVDTSRSSWLYILNQEKLNWINVSDLKGFNGPSADAYNIYATPTMFLLDRNKMIIAKPISIRELEKVLRENKLL